MTREKEFELIKELIKKHFEDADAGLFNTRNIAGDRMATIFTGKYFTLDICYFYSYYEVFGTTEQEFKELKEYYDRLTNGEE